MSNPLDRLNLRPSEKRLVVGVAAVLFVVLNAWFVFPHFSDLAQAQKDREAALDKLKRWDTEIKREPDYKRQIRELESQDQAVPAEDQQNQFSRAIQMQAAQSVVNVTSTGRQSVHTNQFFLELSEQISVEAGEAQLVDFLYNLGSGNSLIRVRDLALHANPPRQALNGNVKLVATFQKNAPKKASGASPAGAAVRTLTSKAR